VSNNEEKIIILYLRILIRIHPRRPVAWIKVALGGLIKLVLASFVAEANFKSTGAKVS
jgi:hypothetical protein